MDHLIRSFLAVELSDRLKEEVQLYIDKIKSEHPNFRFIPPKNWHLTLHFFGPISQIQIEQIKSELPKFLKGIKPFSIFLEGMGAFPHKKEAQILWLGVSGDIPEFLILKKRVDEALTQMRFEIEKRPFHPHLTIARLKSKRSEPALSMPGEFKTKTVDFIQNIALFESILSSEGAVYKALHTFSLS